MSIHDEEIIATGAMLILHGKLPYPASSNRVYELDDFITTHYAERAEFGADRGLRYTILQPRSHAS